MHSKKYFIANWKMNGLKADLNQISIVDNFLKKKNTKMIGKKKKKY